MRSTLAVVVVLALAVPALAAEIDPRSLALQRSDVPAGFRVDPSQTGVRTNRAESRDSDVRRLIARTRRVTGYQVEFERGQAIIGSRVDVFRDARGAEAFLDWIVSETRKAGIRGQRMTRLRLGDEAWLLEGTTGSVFAFVMWRERRVFSGVVGFGLSERRTRALARIQQRRIEAALR